MTTTKGVLVFLCWSVLVSSVLMACCKSAAGDDETWQEVLTTQGRNVVFGAANTYSIFAPNIATLFVSRFFFGLGAPGEAVRTDTTVTLGAFGDASKFYACVDGKLELVDVQASNGAPQNAIIRVRYNTTDRNYRLQISKDSPATFVQFTPLSQSGLLCSSGVKGTPIRFTPSSSFSSHKHPHDPPTIALPQLFDA